MSEEHENEEKPRVGIFYCSGAMSSAGELTGVAAFEVLKRLGPQEVGMGCVAVNRTRSKEITMAVDSVNEEFRRTPPAAKLQNLRSK